MAVARERLATLWWSIVLALVVAGGLVGFVLLPGQERDTLWESFCAAAGLPVRNPAATARGPAGAAPAFAWTPPAQALVRAGDAERGRQAAAACQGCHGERGIGVADMFPNLAGHPRGAVVKQLADYRSGQRAQPIMSPMAAGLDDATIADLGAYYASLPAPGPRLAGAPRLVMVGDPMRSIAPCGSCHGTFGTKEGAPPLEGQKEAYLAAQLRAFADGSRANDINAQMRVVARALTPEEVEQLAAWYARP